MTDPWCCYIWCAMDPINIPPMLAYIPYMDPMGNNWMRCLTEDWWDFAESTTVVLQRNQRAPKSWICWMIMAAKSTQIAIGKHTRHDGKSQLLIGKSTISIAILMNMLVVFHAIVRRIFNRSNSHRCDFMWVHLRMGHTPNFKTWLVGL